MRVLRAFLSWMFAFSALCCLGIVARYTRLAFHPEDFLGAPSVIGRFIVPVVFSGLTLTFTLAWWTSFRRKPSARSWCVAASIVNILVALFPVVLSLRFDYDWSGLPVGLTPIALLLGLGIAGLIVFTRRAEVSGNAAQNSRIAPLPGDGTFGFLNRLSGPLAFAISYTSYSWWLRWIRSHDLWTGWNLFSENLIFFGIVAFIVVIHESGHAVAGLILGMKLRMVALGPLHWSRCKCKWTFEFKPKMMLGRDGAVGLIPLKSRRPRWHEPCVAAAGPAANLISGALALLIALTLSSDSPLQMHGQLALFGAQSISVAIISIIPFRLGQYYSDGARCYQHISNHPLSDLTRVLQAVTSVSETSLRPRDYDLKAIEHALTLFPTGIEAHYLKLYIYDYSFDHGFIADACQALVEAEEIYDSAALKAQTEISFVLGHAALRDDPIAARRWWERLEARDADRSEAGYWLAKCALDHAEGHRGDADEALRQADALIAKLPFTGSRAYDEEWSVRLHCVIDMNAETASVAAV